MTLRLATRYRGPIPGARQVCQSSVPRLDEQVCPKATLDLVLSNKRVNSEAKLSLKTGPRHSVESWNKRVERPQMPAVEMEAQAELAPDLASMPLEPTPRIVHSRERSRSPRRHVEEESFCLTSVHLSHQFGFRDSTLWCWRCGGWSAGSRRVSRLKDSCGAPTKTGADVVYRVSGGFHPKARF